MSTQEDDLTPRMIMIKYLASLPDSPRKEAAWLDLLKRWHDYDTPEERVAGIIRVLDRVGRARGFAGERWRR